eukprot:TRINITY_DN1797_c0_g1_i2.p1 TRINITY_DN1797_c0_g1~~TRINITY_DN1797_c0_g1_i2.p1  ORF type:complete len:659 (+),score=108.61 TRINITY_DN1797_c0_g1_i2:39-1979(+)
MPANNKALRPDHGKKRNVTSIGIKLSGFSDYKLKEEVAQAVHDCGFVQPSEVQSSCIPKALMGKDIICQAQACMERTHVFVLTILHKIIPRNKVVDSLVICRTGTIAQQIHKEFSRISKYLPNVKVGVLCEGIPLREHRHLLETDCPHIVIGTPGRLAKLSKEKKLNLNKLKRFVIDNAEQILLSLKSRQDVRHLLINAPIKRQIMMFSAIMAKETRLMGRKFTQDAAEIYVGEKAKMADDRLLGHWLFDGFKKSIQGAGFVDLSGRGNHIPCRRSSWALKGVVFEHGEQMVIPNSDGALRPRKSLTISAWLYRIGECDGPVVNYGRHGWCCHLWVIKGNRVLCRINGQNGRPWVEPIVSNPLPLRKWVFCATTYDWTTGFNKLFLDFGSGFQLVNKLRIGKLDPGTAGPINVGYTNGQVLRAKVRDLRIYKDALSKTELTKVSKEYNINGKTTVAKHRDFGSGRTNGKALHVKVTKECNINGKSTATKHKVEKQDQDEETPPSTPPSTPSSTSSSTPSSTHIPTSQSSRKYSLGTLTKLRDHPLSNQAPFKDMPLAYPFKVPETKAVPQPGLLWNQWQIPHLRNGAFRKGTSLIWNGKYRDMNHYCLLKVAGDKVTALSTRKWSPANGILISPTTLLMTFWGKRL